jgi:ATP-dependent Zn protease
LESATTIASFMEGHWGMGSTVSSHASNKRFEVGAPGGGGKEKRGDATKEMRRSLADRIESNLATLLNKAEKLLKENRDQVLSLAHALEVHKTLSGEDVAAVIDGVAGPIVDGRPYTKAKNIKILEAYHEAAVRAHRDHNSPSILLPELQ